MNRVAAISWRAVTVGLVSTTLLAGCGSGADDNASSPSRPVVAVSTPLWADVVGNVVCGSLGDQVKIETLIGSDADPHSAEVGLDDRATLDQAQLFIVNGGGLEASFQDTIDAVAEEGTTVLDVFAAVPDRTDPNDPHIWLDPTIVADALSPITEALAALGIPEGDLAQCAETYRGELTEADAQIENGFAALSTDQRMLAAVHGLDYFARRYDLEIVATLSDTHSHAAPSAARIADTIERIKSSGVRVLATDAAEHSDDLHTVEDAVPDLVEVPLVVTGLGEDPDTDTYLEMIEVNGARLSTALGT